MSAVRRGSARERGAESKKEREHGGEAAEGTTAFRRKGWVNYGRGYDADTGY